MLIVYPLIIVFTRPVPKTTQDYIYEYITNRETYTPQTVQAAFHGPLQYIFPLYDEINAPLIQYIENEQLYQGFRPDRITYSPKYKEWIAGGTLFRCSLASNGSAWQCDSSYKEFKIRIVNGKFIVTNSKNG